MKKDGRVREVTLIDLERNEIEVEMTQKDMYEYAKIGGSISIGGSGVVCLKFEDIKKLTLDE